MARGSNGNTNSGSGTGTGLLIIDNLPLTYNWQSLKDTLRKYVPHAIWTDMEIHPCTGQSTGRGYARLGSFRQASDLYRFLTENRIEGGQLIVHLWDITTPPPRLHASNCHKDMGPCKPGCDKQSASRIANDHRWIAIPYMGQANPSYSAAPVMPYPTPTAPAQPQFTPQMLEQQMAAMRIQGQAPVYDYGQVYPPPTGYNPYYPEMRQAQPYPQQPVYRPSSTGLPVNTINGFARTEHRGIFVSRICFSVTQKDLDSLFSKIQGFQSCKLKTDRKGKFVGTATVQFDSEGAARRAIEQYQDCPLKGKPLQLRFDTETTTVEAPQVTRGRADPLVVDGSRGGKQVH